MANKMSDPNSAMMQMVMQMIQNQKPSGNIIKAPQNQNPRDFVKVMPAEVNGMKGVMGFGYIDDSEVMNHPAFQNDGMKSANIEIAPAATSKTMATPTQNERKNVIAPNPQQKQMAKNLAQQFVAQKNQPFTPEQMQVIEEKILQRIMQSMSQA